MYARTGQARVRQAVRQGFFLSPLLGQAHSKVHIQRHTREDVLFWISLTLRGFLFSYCARCSSSWRPRFMPSISKETGFGCFGGWLLKLIVFRLFLQLPQKHLEWTKPFSSERFILVVKQCSGYLNANERNGCRFVNVI
jgi:hypothetical protein